MSKKNNMSRQIRRQVLKGGAITLATAVTSAAKTMVSPFPLFANTNDESVQENNISEEKFFWNSCNVNCGSRCALKVYVKDDVVLRIETDNTGNDDYGNQQLRACPRGRSMRQRLYAKERILSPLKRVGKRGEGKFEAISWEQANEEIASRLKSTLDTYGNESVFLNYGTGAIGSTMGKSWPPASTPIARLMNLLGGYLNHYSDYSTCQISIGMPYLFGGSWVDGNSLGDMVNSELAVFFGNNPAETRASGVKNKTLLHARHTNNTKIIVIDPRYSDTVVTAADQWVPIRPGTDTALCCALAHVMITENLLDYNFIAKYTIGFDEDSLPKDAPINSSYRSYILGIGEGNFAKTPEWASKITGIDVAIIKNLAREMASAKTCSIWQGWGPQRSTNGENQARAIGMLAILTGNVGIHGGNTGARENGGLRLPMATFPTLTNPITTAVSCFNWYEAIDDYTKMTDKTAGIRGREKLIAPIKFIWNYASNCLTNQHGGINQMHDILSDEKKCETIVVIDTTLSSSAHYADYVLPSCSNLEEFDYSSDGDSNIAYVIFNNKCIEPLGESRSIYDICADIAEKMGIRDKFTEARTQYQWLEHLYNLSKQNIPDLPPSLEEAMKLGIFKKHVPSYHVAYQAFREDPKANPLSTPSGKIEIYSERLAKISKDWVLSEDQKITPLPAYIEDPEGFESVKSKTFPLQLIGHHYKQRTHSTYGNCSWLQEVAPQELWINPLDANPRGIKHLDLVKIFNDRGITYIEAKVTARIIPGVVSLPQGAWHTPNENGEDINGCINVLTELKPTALAKGNPHHSNLVQVEKA